MGGAQLTTIYEGAIGYNRAGPIRRGVHVSRQTELLRARRFMPLFAVQTTGAIADNLFKSAFVMLVTFGVTMRTSVDLGALSAIAGAMLIAPFFLFSALAGELADRYERARLLQILKAAEFATVLAAIIALVAGSLALSLVALFALGAQATFSSPVRYALLPQHLHADELVDGNALLEGGTFLAILLGTIAGGIAVALDRGTEAACLLLVLCAACGFAASLLVPRAPAPSPSLRVSRNPVAATAAILRHAWAQRPVKLSILGASWFWLVGAVFLSQIPAFAKETLGAATAVVTLFLAAFSIGVAPARCCAGGRCAARSARATCRSRQQAWPSFRSTSRWPAERRAADRRRPAGVLRSCRALPGCASLSTCS